MVREFSRAYPRPQWPDDRFQSEQGGVDNARFSHAHDTATVSSPPMGVMKALREQCKIPARHYFLAVVLDNGEQKIYSAPDQSREAVPKFFSMEKYARIVANQASAGGSLSEDPDLGYGDYQRHPMAMDYPVRHGYDRQRPHALEGLEEEGSRNRKRARRNLSRQALDMGDDDAPGKVSSTKKSIEIGNDNAVWDIYEQRFKNLQQTACKLIAKAWVKQVAPKKQSTHPYTGAEEKAPEWWPKPWGPTKDQAVRHKEPDHLYKRERVYLLNHILRMVTEPNASQHPDIRKLNLNVAKLEEATYEALSSFFTDPDNLNNAKKKPYLKEIFYVAKNEEKYRNGEIDASTSLYIMGDDRISECYPSDNEDASPTKEDDEQDTPNVSSSVSPHRVVNPGQMSAPGSEHGAGTHLPAGPAFLGELPHRGPPYAAQMIHHAELAPEQHPYMEGGLAVGGQTPMPVPHSGLSLQEMCPNPQDSSQRPSPYQPQPSFSSSASPAMYSQWQQGTAAPSSLPTYAFPPQQQVQVQTHAQAQAHVQAHAQVQAQAQAQAQGQFAPPSAVAMSQSQQYLPVGASYDGLPRTPFDAGHGHMFHRPASVSTGPVDAQGYPMQLPHHGSRPVGGGPLKGEPNIRRLH